MKNILDLSSFELFNKFFNLYENLKVNMSFNTATIRLYKEFFKLVDEILYNENSLQYDAYSCCVLASVIKFDNNLYKSEQVDKELHLQFKTIELAENNNMRYFPFKRLAELYLLKDEFLKSAQYYEIEHFYYQEKFYGMNYNIPPNISTEELLNLGKSKPSENIINYNQKLMYEQFSFPIKAGEIYLKAGISYAIDFILRQKQCKYYFTSNNFKTYADKYYDMVINKKKNNYIYKPRKKKQLISKLLSYLNKLIKNKGENNNG